MCCGLLVFVALFWVACLVVLWLVVAVFPVDFGVLGCAVWCGLACS